MDEKVERAGPDTAVDRSGRAAVLSAERLATRVAVLGAQVRALVPQDQGRLPQPGDPTDESRGSLERVQALELLLRQAREREDRLTTQTIHDQVTLAELQARDDELEWVKAAGAVTEAARAAAEARAADASVGWRSWRPSFEHGWWSSPGSDPELRGSRGTSTRSPMRRPRRLQELLERRASRRSGMRRGSALSPNGSSLPKIVSARWKLTGLPLSYRLS